MNHYRNMIIDMLEGRSSGLKSLPSERLDWYGLGAVLDLYQQSSGTDREDVIRAIGQIIDDAALRPVLLAQVIHFVSSLDLAQVEPSIVKLRERPVASEEPVKGALLNYAAFRDLNNRPNRTRH